MLNLSKSKERKKILQFFFSDINRKHYLREMERILNISVGNIRRELLSLEKDGLFIKERMGNQVYYSLNQKSPIFTDIKNIVSKTIGIEAILKKELSKLENIDFAFIYGSFAKGNEYSLSDIDVFILGEEDEAQINEILSKAEKELSREINYTLFFKNEFKKEFKNNVFLKDVISNKKIFLINNEDEFKKIIKRKEGL